MTCTGGGGHKPLQTLTHYTQQCALKSAQTFHSWVWLTKIKGNGWNAEKCVSWNGLSATNSTLEHTYQLLWQRRVSLCLLPLGWKVPFPSLPSAMCNFPKHLMLASFSLGNQAHLALIPNPLGQCPHLWSGECLPVLCGHMAFANEVNLTQTLGRTHTHTQAWEWQMYVN